MEKITCIYCNTCKIKLPHIVSSKSAERIQTIYAKINLGL